jgi:DNA polymerase I-like protein with 3'-5' exonuclease and polymerase domains
VTEFALDTEERDNGLAGGRGPGWAFGDGYVAGVGIAWRTGTEIQKIYVPVRHPDTECFPKEQVARWLTDITRKRRVVMFNAGYDIGWLHADLGVPIPPVIDDASCAAFMINENRDDMSLDGCCAWRGVEGKDLAALREAAHVYGVKPDEAVANIWRLPARYAAPYGEQDPASTLLLMEDLRPELVRQGLIQAYSVEMRLIPIIHAMRRRGIRIDIDRAEQFRDAMLVRSQRALDDLSSHLHRRIGMEEVRSHNWLLQTFDMERVPYGHKGEKVSFDKDWMRRAEHWLPRLVAEAKQCRDMADKFVGSYLLDFCHRGRIHASINQWKYEEGGTRSHRLSYADPPLQQAPSRPEPFDGWPLTGENATEYRMCFLPEEGELWYAPDYSQQEYRHIVADAERLGLPRADVAGAMYRRDPKTDFHNVVVELTGLPRRHAKDCNFAKAFGAGVPKFATMINKPLEEASAIMGTYDEQLPFVKLLGQRCDSLAQSRGWIKMFDGARSHFDLYEAAWLSKEERQRGYAWNFRMSPCSLEEARERQRQTIGEHAHPWAGVRLKRAFTHKAMNRRIQGNAARQTKLAMVTCGEEGYIPMLQMHDELCFSSRDPRMGARVEEIMRTVYTCSVPFLVDSEWGTNWGTAKKVEGKDKRVLYGATFEEAARMAREGRYWERTAPRAKGRARRA